LSPISEGNYPTTYENRQFLGFRNVAMSGDLFGRLTFWTNYWLLLMAITPTKPGILPSCRQVFKGEVTRPYFLKSARVSALFLIKYKAIRLRTRVKSESSFLKGTPNVRLDHCLPERAIDLEEEIDRRLIVIERQYVLSSSLQNPK
jgi:hypothetical protein